jgi:hypothetical protein
LSGRLKFNFVSELDYSGFLVYWDWSSMHGLFSPKAGISVGEKEFNNNNTA